MDDYEFLAQCDVAERIKEEHQALDSIVMHLAVALNEAREKADLKLRQLEDAVYMAASRGAKPHDKPEYRDRSSSESHSVLVQKDGKLTEIKAKIEPGMRRPIIIRTNIKFIYPKSE